MKNWNEAREGMVVYIVNEIEVSDADNVLIALKFLFAYDIFKERNDSYVE